MALCSMAETCSPITGSFKQYFVFVLGLLMSINCCLSISYIFVTYDSKGKVLRMSCSFPKGPVCALGSLFGV